MVRYTELSRPVQKFRALTANPRASQQLMGQSPICYCLKAKKFNDFAAKKEKRLRHLVSADCSQAQEVSFAEPVLRVLLKLTCRVADHRGA